MISDEQLLEWNKEGLIPGPTENNETFLARVRKCLEINKILSNNFQDSLPKSIEKNSEQYIKEAFPITESLFDIAPKWVPIIFTNKKLSLWHAGAAWIFQLEEEGQSCTAALLQLRQNWLKSSSYLKIYSRNEIIAHELCHIGRMMFEEPKFEEILAYNTSSSAFRRWYGSIIQNSKEALTFLFSLFLLVAISFYAAISDNESLYRISSWLQLLPFGLAIFGIFRLRNRHIQKDRCLNHLNQLLNEEKKSLAVLYRLTDQEIINFSKMQPDQIQQYAQKNKDLSLRWRLIYLAYFS